MKRKFVVEFTVSGEINKYTVESLNARSAVQVALKESKLNRDRVTESRVNPIEYHMWFTGAGTYQEIHQAAMEKYFGNNNIPYVEVDYKLDDYSDIIAASPDFDIESLDEAGYESGGALKPDETNLAFILYEAHGSEEVATLTVKADVNGDGEKKHKVTVYRETITPKDVTYHIYFASMEE